MALNKKPVNGMKDILPEEMQIRDYVIGCDQRNLSVNSALHRSKHRAWRALAIFAASRAAIMKS